MRKCPKTAQVADALLYSVKDEAAFDGIMSALEADLGILLARLRAGIASNAEQAFAADLIAGKKKPKQPKGLPWYQRRELASIVVLMDKAYPYGHPRGQRQIAIEETVKYAKKRYKVSSRYLYKMLAEFSPHMLAKINALRERPTRLKKRFPGKKVTINVDGVPVSASSREPVIEVTPEVEIRAPAYDVRDIDHDKLVLLVEGFLARNDVLRASILT
jgi:hypothetical protein